MRTVCFSILFFILFSVVVAGSDDADCVYTLYVKTGSRLYAGTSSTIDVTLLNSDGESVTASNLTSYGIMKSGHSYFRRKNVDIFAVRSTCIATPICRLELVSDGTGINPGWYCKYVQVNFAGLDQSCNQTTFSVEQWLRKGELTASVDLCSSLNELPEQKIEEERSTVENYDEFSVA